MGVIAGAAALAVGVGLEAANAAGAFAPDIPSKKNILGGTLSSYYGVPSISSQQNLAKLQQQLEAGGLNLKQRQRLEKLQDQLSAATNPRKQRNLQHAIDRLQSKGQKALPGIQEQVHAIERQNELSPAGAVETQQLQQLQRFLPQYQQLQQQMTQTGTQNALKNQQQFGLQAGKTIQQQQQALDPGFYANRLALNNYLGQQFGVQGQAGQFGGGLPGAGGGDGMADAATLRQRYTAEAHGGRDQLATAGAGGTPDMPSPINVGQNISLQGLSPEEIQFFSGQIGAQQAAHGLTGGLGSENTAFALTQLDMQQRQQNLQNMQNYLNTYQQASLPNLFQPEQFGTMGLTQGALQPLTIQDILSLQTQLAGLKYGQGLQQQQAIGSLGGSLIGLGTSGGLSGIGSMFGGGGGAAGAAGGGGGGATGFFGGGLA